MGLGMGARGERRKRVVSITRGGQKIMPRARRLVVSHYGDSKTAGSVILTILLGIDAAPSPTHKSDRGDDGAFWMRSGRIYRLDFSGAPKRYSSVVR